MYTKAAVCCGQIMPCEQRIRETRDNMGTAQSISKIPFISHSISNGVHRHDTLIFYSYNHHS